MPTYGVGDEILYSTPIPKLPEWRKIMEDEVLFTCEGLHEDDFNITYVYLQPAIVPIIASHRLLVGRLGRHERAQEPGQQ